MTRAAKLKKKSTQPKRHRPLKEQTTMKLDDLTIGEAKEIAKLVRGGTLSNGKSHSLKVGEKYFVRSVTHYYTGKLLDVTDADIVLGDAAWIADTGRFAEALKTGKFNEVEPFPDQVVINRDGLIDISPWPHSLPREVK